MHTMLTVSVLLPCRETNSQYKVAIRSTTNSAAGLVITLQVQTSSSVITAPVVTQALTVSSLRQSDLELT